MGVALPFVGLLLGIVAGLAVNVHLPAAYAAYLSVAILAALDSVFGGLRAGMQGNFAYRVFLSGFFINTLLAPLPRPSDHRWRCRCPSGRRRVPT